MTSLARYRLKLLKFGKIFFTDLNPSKFTGDLVKVSDEKVTFIFALFTKPAANPFMNNDKKWSNML